MTNAPKMNPKVNDDGTMDVDQMSLEECFAYGMGHNNCSEIVRQLLVDEKDDLELYQEFVSKFNAHVLSKNCFNI